MGDQVEDFINSFIWDVPAQKRFIGSKVVKWKKVFNGPFDDWSSGVAGTYISLVYKNNKPFATMTTLVKLHERYDKNNEEPYEDFEDAAIIKGGKIRLINKVPRIFLKK